MPTWTSSWGKLSRRDPVGVVFHQLTAREAVSKIRTMTDTQSPLDEARHVLQQHFGYNRFKAAQEQVILSALNGEDVLAVLQTGYGKSVCFQVPAAMRDGCAIVISPLIALMKDQVDGAIKRGISASFVNSSLDPSDVTKRLNEFASGAFKLLYVAPERIGTQQFRAALARATVSFIVVDEAHCASMWGHDFRPAFSRIHEISSLLWDASGERPPIIAVTATATADIENDIAASVGMVDGYTRVVGDPIRPNLNYDTFGGTSEWSAVMRVARSRFHMQGKHLVYASTRKGTEKVAQMLCEDFGEKFAAAYHGGMDKDDRTKVQDDFVSGRVRVVCATNAFGMGIDVPDIRTVVHLGVPGSIESYVQETGRAGRDGHPATVVLIDSDYAVKLQRSFIAGSNPPIQLYTTLWNWLLSRCSGGNTLRMSAASIAEDVSRGQAEDVSESAIGTILNVLEGHKLIGREYYEGGAPVTVRMDTDSIAKLKACRVGAWLLKKAEASRSGGGSIEISVDKTDAPFEIGMSARAFSKELTELDLSDAINVGRVFTGKTTTMLRPDAELLSVLPVELIEKKRKRDLDRFEAMLRYSRLPTHSDRVKFVRSYFLNNG